MSNPYYRFGLKVLDTSGGSLTRRDKDSIDMMLDIPKFRLQLSSWACDFLENIKDQESLSGAQRARFNEILECMNWRN